jgi:poly(hydroxyalkanoate) depolymerase family esterase
VLDEHAGSADDRAMLRLARRWFKRKVAAVIPLIARAPVTGRSRFLVATFKDPGASAPLRQGLRHNMGYRLYLPSGSASRDSLPLMVMLHGCTQDPLSFAEGTRMNTLAEVGRFAVLYPAQSKRSNPMRCWNWFEAASLEGDGEAALIARLVDQITERRPIDPRRVYVAGMSAGGAMACVLAVRHSRLFAACAIHSGLMFGAANSPMQALDAMRAGPPAAAIDAARRLACTADESAVIVPTLVIQGDRDVTVNPVNADEIIEQLKARSEFIGSANGPLLASRERRIENNGRTYRQDDYVQRGQVVLRKILIEGLGHAWSGGDDRYEFNEPAGPDAARLIVDFVMQFRREHSQAARWTAG